MTDYATFLREKQRIDKPTGFDASAINSMLFPFQQAIDKWACRRGRAAIFAECGLGKTGMQLEWARQVAEHTGGKVLVLAPLAVAAQTEREAVKFGIGGVGVVRSQDGCEPFRVCITNYEMLQHFDPAQFAGVVLDESSILKNFTGSTRTAIIEAFAQTPFRLACTATPAPNDYMELGNHAEFVGSMTRTEMLSMFFCHDGGDTSQWRLKGHAEGDFWRWVCSWAITMRKPSDIGFSDEGFDLPELSIVEHIVDADPIHAGFLFDVAPTDLDDRRRARRASIDERIALAVSLAHGQADVPIAGLVSREQAQDGSGGEVALHAPLLPRASGEVGDDRGEAGAKESSSSRDLRFGSEAPGGAQVEVSGVLGEESRPQEGREAQEVRSDAGSVSGHAGRSGRGVRDLRRSERSQDHLPGSGSLSSNRGGSRPPVCKLQPRAGQVQGSNGSSCASDRLSESWIFWCGLNEEQDRIAKLFGDRAFSVQGSDSNEDKADRLNRWLAGERPILVTKASLLGFGINMQTCHKMAFVGLSDSYEALYQAIRRCYRFGQKHRVEVHIITAATEGATLDNIKRKERDAVEMQRAMVEHMRDITKEELTMTSRNMTNYAESTTSEGPWTMHLGDCVEVAKRIPDNSIGFSVFSPPFASLYTYSASDRDMGNCIDDAQFMAHFRFLVDELFRVTMPGRNLSFHCMNLPTSKARDGVIGIRDFRGELIRMFCDAGWIFHSEVTIWKDPVTAMQRTKALGLLHKQLLKDSCMSRQSIPDYLVTMRKPGDNTEPVAHWATLPGGKVKGDASGEQFEVGEWQKYASPVWMDINPSDTLQGASAREDADERHICPLQLEVIRRALRLWSRQGDTVLSPFGGIGSEGFESVKEGRKFIGIELKRSYYEQACRNLRAAVLQRKQLSLFG